MPRYFHWLCGALCDCLFALGVLLPLRPSYSDAEKRELEEVSLYFPLQGLFAGSYFRDITSWYQDSYPGKEWMLLASKTRALMACRRADLRSRRAGQRRNSHRGRCFRPDLRFKEGYGRRTERGAEAGNPMGKTGERRRPGIRQKGKRRQKKEKEQRKSRKRQKQAKRGSKAKLRCKASAQRKKKEETVILKRMRREICRSKRR